MIFSDPREFIGWLQDMEPDAIAGYTCTSSDCPGARFARTKGAYNPLVDSKIITYRDDITDYIRKDEPLPEWMQVFISDLDNGADDEYPVTAWQCLALLVPFGGER